MNAPRRTWVVDLRGFGRVVTGLRIEAPTAGDAKRIAMERYGVEIVARPARVLNAETIRGTK